MAPQKISATDVTTWPKDLLYRWAERTGIKMDSHTPQRRAEAEAQLETWNEWLTESFDPMSEAQ